MPNTLDDLREELFATLKGLRDKTMDVDRARAISDVAGKVIDSAKVEVDYLRATGRDDLTLPVIEPKPAGTDELPAGVTGIKTHRLK